MENNKKLYLIAYDIQSNKKRRLVHKLLKSYGFSVQYSIFMAELRNSKYSDLKANIERIFENYPNVEDTYILINICQTCRLQMVSSDIKTYQIKANGLYII